MQQINESELIEKLFADPSSLDAMDVAIDLIFAYGDGMELETLRPLLRSDDPTIRKIAAMVFDELGNEACSLIDDVIPLCESNDDETRIRAVKMVYRCTDKNPHNLIKRIMQDPERAGYDALANILIEEYCGGFEIETLRRLITHSDLTVQSLGAYILSELGENADVVINDGRSLLASPEDQIRGDALSFLWQCSYARAEHRDEFFHVVEAMADINQGNRLRSMDLLERSNDQQLMAGICHYESQKSEEQEHSRGLKFLLHFSELTQSELSDLIKSSNPILRKYGVIAATKQGVDSYNQIRQLLSNLDDDIRQHATSYVCRHDEIIPLDTI